MSHRVALLELPTGDGLVLVDGKLIYVEDPSDKEGSNTLCSAQHLAENLAANLCGSATALQVIEVGSTDVAFDREDWNYDDVVDWYQAKFPIEKVSVYQALLEVVEDCGGVLNGELENKSQELADWIEESASGEDEE